MLDVGPVASDEGRALSRRYASSCARSTRQTRPTCTRATCRKRTFLRPKAANASRSMRASAETTEGNETSRRNETKGGCNTKTASCRRRRFHARAPSQVGRLPSVRCERMVHKHVTKVDVGTSPRWMGHRHVARASCNAAGAMPCPSPSHPPPITHAHANVHKQRRAKVGVGRMADATPTQGRGNH